MANSPKDKGLSKLIKITTAAVLTAIALLIGWTGFFLAQALEIFPNIGGAPEVSLKEVEIESVNIRLMQEEIGLLESKKSLPEPSKADLNNPFFLAPPVLPETPPEPAAPPEPPPAEQPPAP